MGYLSVSTPDTVNPDAQPGRQWADDSDREEVTIFSTGFHKIPIDPPSSKTKSTTIFPTKSLTKEMTNHQTLTKKKKESLLYIFHSVLNKKLSPFIVNFKKMISWWHQINLMEVFFFSHQWTFSVWNKKKSKNSLTQFIPLCKWFFNDCKIVMAQKTGGGFVWLHTHSISRMTCKIKYNNKDISSGNTLFTICPTLFTRLNRLHTECFVLTIFPIARKMPNLIHHMPA